jgi:UDP-N-acetylglucosamine/UDP-N-acetylgalactosamine diphosphorylase
MFQAAECPTRLAIAGSLPIALSTASRTDGIGLAMSDAALPDALRKELVQFDQLHLIRFWDSLSEQEKQSLLEQIRHIDFALMQRLALGADDAPDWACLAAKAEPPPAIRLKDEAAGISSNAALQAGEEALRNNRVAMILAAGGQGTRLGFDHPKGLFPIAPLSRRTLFEMHVDRLRAVGQRYGVKIPLLVMTSPATDMETRNYFLRHRNLGLRPEELTIFCQGSMPAVDAVTGKILLASKGEIALSPDGHGGLLAALNRHGLLNTAAHQGIEYFFYAQVDNPLVPPADAALLGYHILARSEMTTQVVQKRFALEKVGNVVAIDGKVQIIEYSDLPSRFAEQTNTDGSLKLWAGNIAVHIFDVGFLRRVSQHAGALPFHRARKPVPCLDPSGNPLQPTGANAIKFERFIFDLLPLAERAIVVEGDAREVFAPVKNADGAATDTPAATQAALIALHSEWLKSAGCTIGPGVKVEIHPTWALDATEVQFKINQPLTILGDTYFA